MFADHMPDKQPESRIHKGLKKRQTQFKERATDLGRHFSTQDKRHTKMCTIISHQGNANPNHDEIPLHTHQDGCKDKTEKSKCWRGRGEDGAPLRGR